MKFLIWSIEHTAWWGPGGMGYTTDLRLAGTYDETQTERILKSANLVRVNECLIPIDYVGRGFAGELLALRAYLDTLTITGHNIGDIRRALFVPWESVWNGIVRDETAARENR